MESPYKSVFADEMSSYLKLLEDAGQHVASYQVTFKSLDAFLFKNNITKKELNEPVISNWLRSLTCKTTTKNGRIGQLRQFARYLNALKIPAYEYSFMKAQSSFTAYTFTDDEFTMIITAADDFASIKSSTNTSAYVFPIVLRILYGCGLRIGEALALCWSDVNFVDRMIIVRKAKNHKQRLVPMSDSLAELLKLYYARQSVEKPNASLLFESNINQGKPYLVWTFRQWFLSILEYTSIKICRSEPFEHSVSPHTLRHYFTYKAFLKAEDSGRSLEETVPFLAAYLGHETMREIEKYLTTDYTVYESSQKRMNESIGGVFPEVKFE